MDISAYILLFVVFIILLKLFDKKFRFLAFTPLVLFSGFRLNVGRDYSNYHRVFNEIISANIVSKIEFGYAAIVKFAFKLKGNQQLVFLIMAFLTMFFTYKFLKEFSLDFELSSILFLLIGLFYLNSFNSVRQSLSISIMLYSLKPLINKKYILFFCYSFFAFSIHRSALLFLFIIPFLKIDIKLGKKFFIAFLLIYLASSNIIIKILKFLNYTKVLNFTYYRMNLTQILFLIISLTLIIINNFKIKISDNLVLNFTKVLENDQENIIMKNLIFLSGFLVLLAFTTRILPNIAIIRFNNYFMYSYLIVLPNMVTKIKNRNIRSLVKFVIIVFSFIYYINLILNEGSLLPYRTNFKIFN